MKLRELGQRGHLHLVMPIVSIVAVAAIGGAYIAISRAATACVATNLQANSKGACVQYVQQMFNGSDAYALVTYYPVSTINSSSMTSLLGSPRAFAVNNSFGKTTSVYDTGTKNLATAYQNWINDSAVASSYFHMTQAAFNSSFKPHGNLPTTGLTESKTWYSLCQFMNKVPASARATTNSTDFTGGKPNSAGTNKTNMWYFRSYMRAGYSAANKAGCAVALKGTSAGSSSGGTKATTKPAAPKNIAISGSSTHGFTASWPAVSGATGYGYRITLQGQTSLYKGLQRTFGTPQATISGLESGRSYYLYVWASNSLGDSPEASVLVAL